LLASDLNKKEIKCVVLVRFIMYKTKLLKTKLTKLSTKFYAVVKLNY